MYAPNTSGNKQTEEANEQANSSPPEAFKLLSYYYHELILNSKQPCLFHVKNEAPKHRKVKKLAEGDRLIRAEFQT